MNRRGFLGTVAGAFVGGAFCRLAPPPRKPLSPASPLIFDPFEYRFMSYGNLMTMRPGPMCYGLNA